jgi:hypothetical protein
VWVWGINPLPLLLRALLHGQKDCVFFSGHLNGKGSKSALERLGLHGTFKSWVLCSIMDSKGLRWVHTCNVTMCHNGIKFLVTNTIQSYDLNFHPMPHGVTVSCKCYTMRFPVCYGSQKHHECKEGERSGRWWCVMLHVQTCSGCNRIIPLMRWPNTNSTPNMPVSLLRNELLICYVVMSPIHTVIIQCYIRGNVTNVYPPLKVVYVCAHVSPKSLKSWHCTLLVCDKTY